MTTTPDPQPPTSRLLYDHERGVLFEPSWDGTAAAPTAPMPDEQLEQIRSLLYDNPATEPAPWTMRWRAHKLYAEVDRLRGERDGDVRAVFRVLRELRVNNPGVTALKAVTRLEERFADRIAVLEARDAKAPAKRTPEEWGEQYGVEIRDPDGWRGKNDPPWTEPITLADFYDRAIQSTVRNVPSVDWKRIARDAKGGEHQ